jgi:hypothetical protein
VDHDCDTVLPMAHWSTTSVVLRFSLSSLGLGHVWIPGLKLAHLVKID